MKQIAITVDVEKSFKDELTALDKLLEEKDIKTTLFVTADCFQKDPDFFKKMAEKGHEIELHGYLHERWDVLHEIGQEIFLNKAIVLYKNIFGRNPKGFRAPQFSANFSLIKLLEDKGFSYDSSLVQMPITQSLFFPSRIMLYLKQHLFRFRKKKIKEIPVSTFGLPLSMFVLKRFPKLFGFACIFKSRIIFLTHSYELDERGLTKIKEFINKNEGAEFVKMEDIKQ